MHSHKLFSVKAVASALFIMFALALTPFTTVVAGAATQTWHLDTTPSPTGSWFAVLDHGGTWVALGRTADVAISTNGVTWVEHAVPGGSWQSLAYGDGKWVALSSEGGADSVMTATNPTSWTTHPAPSHQWSSLTYGGGRFVAVSFDGYTMTSVDGIHWSAAQAYTLGTWFAVAYGNGVYVAVDGGSDANIITSTDGTHWIYRPIPQILSAGQFNWGAVTFGNGTFVIFDDGPSGYMLSSTDGTTWSAHPYANAQLNYSAAFGCNEFVGSGTGQSVDTRFNSSANGTSWTEQTVPNDFTADWSAIGYGNGKFVAVNSAGGIAWTSTPTNCAQSVPNPPTTLHGTVGDGSLTASWNAPTDTGASKITAYQVTATSYAVSPASQASCTSTTTTCSLKGLHVGVAYQVTVAARNGAGWSAPSDPIQVYGVTAPGFRVSTTPIVVQVGDLVTAIVNGAPVGQLVQVSNGSQTIPCHANGFGQCSVLYGTTSQGEETFTAHYTTSHTYSAIPFDFYAVGLSFPTSAVPATTAFPVTFSDGIPNSTATVAIGNASASVVLDSSGNGTVEMVSPSSSGSFIAYIYDANVEIARGPLDVS
jgi:hypothetical protein